MRDLIDRAEAIEAIGKKSDEIYITKQKGATYPHGDFFQGMAYAESVVKQLPSAQPERDIAKRVLWSGWKGYRDTRYKCPNCNKPVRNDDAFCHRCGQKLMFPQISWTPYVEGQKQELIVRWDDE